MLRTNLDKQEQPNSADHTKAPEATHTKNKCRVGSNKERAIRSFSQQHDYEASSSV